MEWAFRGPFTLRERLDTLDVRDLAALDEERMEEVFRTKPALHRYPGSMARRALALCRHVVSEYDGDAERVWADVSDADTLYERLRALPGYGDEKAKIMVAGLAKRFGVRPSGWEVVSAPFSDDEPRTVADVDSPEALARVREWKRARKTAGAGKAD